MGVGYSFRAGRRWCRCRQALADPHRAPASPLSRFLNTALPCRTGLLQVSTCRPEADRRHATIYPQAHNCTLPPPAVRKCRAPCARKGKNADRIAPPRPAPKRPQRHAGLRVRTRFAIMRIWFRMNAQDHRGGVRCKHAAPQKPHGAEFRQRRTCSGPPQVTGHGFFEGPQCARPSP